MDTTLGDSIPVIRTVLLCDLVASTQLVERVGDSAAADLLARHDRLARDLLVDFGGREIDKSDGFLLLFERPIAALRFALAYRGALRDLGAAHDATLASRVGIHVGEVVLRENPKEDIARGAKPLEVEGLAKAIAARVMSLADDGRILLTRTAYDLARRSSVGTLEEESLRWAVHGPYRLAGVEDPIEVCEVAEAAAHLGLLEEAYAAGGVARLGPAGASDDLLGPDAYRTSLLFQANMPELRNDPRFPRLCARFGLVEFWTSTGKWPDCAAEVPYDFAAECARAADVPKEPFDS